MFHLRISAALAVLATVIFATSSRADVNVGDSPQVAFKSLDGKTIDLKAYKGKIVVIDFWATWCGPCMAEAGHMVETNDKYKDKGLALVGISLDDDKAAVTNVVKEKNFTWPQFFDGRGWQNKFATAFGVHSIPRTFLLDPDGKVIWSGHPAQLDAPLEKAFKDTPPRLVDPATVEKATATLEQVEASIKSGDDAAAIKAFATLPPDARKDGSVDTRAKKAEEKLQAAAQGMLAEVETQVQQKDYVAATKRLRELIAILGASDAGTKAKQRLSQISAMPDAQAAIAAADKSAKADTELAVAQQLATDKKDEQAYARYKGIVKQFPGTDAAKSAADAIKTYEQDPAFVKRANEAAAGGKAKGMLGLAQSYKSAGRTEQARAKYQEVIDQFPGTSFAETAARDLAALK
jgi:thiol-disulfide isomerase/thioredoxin